MVSNEKLSFFMCGWIAAMRNVNQTAHKSHCARCRTNWQTNLTKRVNKNEQFNSLMWINLQCE